MTKQPVRKGGEGVNKLKMANWRACIFNGLVHAQSPVFEFFHTFGAFPHRRPCAFGPPQSMKIAALKLTGLFSVTAPAIFITAGGRTALAKNLRSSFREGSMEHAPHKLAVVIPTIGRYAELRSMLKSLAGQTRLPEQVLIAGEDEGNAEIAREFRQLNAEFINLPGSSICDVLVFRLRR